MGILGWIEATAVATWVRESISLFAYPTILSVHAIGLAFLVGASAVISLRLLGVAQEIPLAPVEKIFAVAWAGFWVNAISGTLLLMAAATSMLTNPVFVIKLVFIVFAVVNLRIIKTRVFGDRESIEAGVVPKIGRTLAWSSLGLWFGAIVAGRLTAYTLLIASTFGGGS